MPPEGAAAPVGGRVDLLPAAIQPVADEEPAPTPEQLAIDQGLMPDLRGFPSDEAAAVFPSGFRVLQRDVYVDLGLVITTDPLPHRALATDLVTIWVSEGPGPPEPDEPPDPPEPIDVPIPDDFLEH